MNECRRVLVVDDDVTQRELLITLLISLDYEVTAVATGTEALAAISQCVPLLLLLDIGLPDIDGLEVMDKMRSIPGTEELIVILISGTTDTTTIAAGLERGAADFIPKPVNEVVLKVKLENQFRLQESRIKIQQLNEQLADEKLQIEEERNLLARYFSADLIKAILSGEVSTKIGGEVRTASILFCDMRNSTDIAERIEPEAFVDLVNNLFTDVTDIIYGEGGSVNKFVGDGILATFGCPGDLEDDAYHCASVALKVRKYLENFNEFRPAYLDEPIRLGIGMSRGKVFAGNVGSVHQIQYTVMGDPVNLASRLEGLTKRGKVDVLMCGEMRDTLGSRAKVMKANLDRVRGKLNQVRVYHLVELSN
jgi:adenylate cyclase